MALIECPKCGKQISDLAKTCTYCGYSLKEPDSPVPAEEPTAGAAEAEKASSGGSFKSLFEGDRKIWWILGGAFALMALIALILTLALGGKNNAATGTGDASSPAGTAATATPQPASTKPSENTNPAPQTPENGGSGGFDLGNLFNNLINSTNP